MFDLTDDEILIATIFILVIVALLLFLPIIVKGISIWHKNNNSPRLSVPVKIVTKRAHTDVSNGDSHTQHIMLLSKKKVVIEQSLQYQVVNMDPW